MNTLADRLTWARTQKSIRDGAEFTQSALAAKAGVSQGSIGHLESGRTQSSRRLTAIAAALEVDAAWLAENKGTPFSSSGTEVAIEPIPGAMQVVLTEEDDPSFYQIPMVKLRLSAGVTGFQADPDETDGATTGIPRIWADQSGYSPHQLVAIKIKGESMEPKMHADDTVVINLADRKLVDGAVFAVNYEGEAVVKRLSRDAGEWWLTSDNPDQRKYHRKLCRGGACIIIGRIVRLETVHI